MITSVIRNGFMTGLILAAIMPTHESQAKEITHIISLKGTCKKLIGYSMDVSDQCENKIVNIEYSDGRLLFTFVARKNDSDYSTFSFSGAGKKQIHQDEDTVSQPIDHLISTFGGKTNTNKAVGKCIFTNPYKGPAMVNCAVDTSEGQFIGFFNTDGSEPIDRSMSQNSIVPEARKNDPNLPAAESDRFEKANTELSQCMLPKIQYGQYSSYDGGKSAVRILGDDCPKESSYWIEACVATTEHTRKECEQETIILAQAAIKLMGK